VRVLLSFPRAGSTSVQGIANNSFLECTWQQDSIPITSSS
jgi:hypothetical protein